MDNSDNIAIRKFGLRDKIGYFCGDLGAEGFFDIASTFLMVYYTDIFGISPVLTGSIFAFARVWDAFMDIAAGRFIDMRPTTKAGKFRPWIIRFCPVLFLSAILMYVKIPGLSSNGYLVYATITYILWGTCHSFCTIPYGAMLPVMTNDPAERTSLSTFRSAASNIAQMAVKTIIPLAAFVNNKPVAGRFFMVAVVIAIFGMINYSVFYALTTERIVAKKGATVKPSLLVSIRGLSKNKPFIVFIIAALILLTSLMISNSLNTYLFKDYYRNAKAMSLNGIVLILNVILIAPLVSPLVKKFGKKEVASGALLFTSIGYFLLYFIPIKNGFVFIAASWIANIGMVLFNFMTWAFVTDLIDYQEYITGQREEGTVLSLYTFSRKLGQSLAGIFSGIALQAAGYVKAPHQTLKVAANIRNYATLIPAILCLIIFFIIAFLYPMNKNKLVELSKKLAEKRLQINSGK